MTTPSGAAGRGGWGRGGPTSRILLNFHPVPRGWGSGGSSSTRKGAHPDSKSAQHRGVTCPGCGPETPDPLRRLVLFIPILQTKPLRHRELRKSRAGPEPDLWASEPTRPSATPTTSAAGCAKPHLLAPAGVDSRREQTQSGRLANHGYSRPRRPLSRHSSLCAPISPASEGGPRLLVQVCLSSAQDPARHQLSQNLGPRATTSLSAQPPLSV